MANITAYRASDKFIVDVGDGKIYHVPSNNFAITELSATTLRISFDPISTARKSWDGLITEVIDKYGNAYGTTMKAINRGIGSGVDVNIQDNVAPLLIAHFTQTEAQTTLAIAGALDDETINVTSAAGIIIGQHITLFSATEERVYFGHVLAINSLVITTDTPLDFAFPSGSFIDFSDDNLAVDGSITTQVFGLRGGGSPVGVDLDFDCTRIVFHCITENANDLSTFGDLPPLLNGLVFRRRDGIIRNIFNVKSNGELAGIAYDLKIESSLNPNQGQDGFYARITFAGQNKMGAALRIGVGEDLEFLVQDNLSTITVLEVVAQGHIVQY